MERTPPTHDTLIAGHARAGAGVVAAPAPDGRENLQQLVVLRWIAVVGQVLTLGTVHVALDIRLPLVPMAIVLLCLSGFNLASQWRLRRRWPIEPMEVFIALTVDVAALTLQLHHTGGATNPFVFLYLLQVVLGAVLLQPVWAWVLAGIACASFAALTSTYLPLPVPLDPDGGLRSPYMLGLALCFGMCAVLLTVFVTRIGANLRLRDARLADLRQRAAEEEHVVRMGMLASGAAHELGTPLATLSVLLGDWRRMPPFTQDPGLSQDLDEMQTQLDRCKRILTGILSSAGETRGEAPMETRLNVFLDELVADWRRTRPGAPPLDVRNRIDDDLRIVSDPALKQTLGNVLDNALEASRGWIGLEARYEDEDLVLRIADDGPGFGTETLERLGRPYNSTKGRAGGGLGLFLVVNVVRKLGGSVEAGNRPAGGAEVTLRLPLAAISLPDEDDDDAD